MRAKRRASEKVGSSSPSNGLKDLRIRQCRGCVVPLVPPPIRQRNGIISVSRSFGVFLVSVLDRHHINILGHGPRTMVLAHGYGCDQIMWRFLSAELQLEYRIVLFDHVGAGKSDLSAYSRQKYASLQGYADDVLEIIAATSDGPVIFVGHSVSAMIGVLAANQKPERVRAAYTGWSLTLLHQRRAVRWRLQPERYRQPPADACR